jgi:hypothetical protein
VTIPPRAPDARPPLESVTYVSSASGSLTDADLEGLLTSARHRNEQQGVTGALLFHDGSFFQYFEGPPAGVEDVYGHIRRSRLHGGIIELDRSPMPARQFPRWLMGFTHVPTSSILRLSGASWRAAVRGMGGPEIRAEGMELLLSFWRSTGNRGA